MTEHAGCPGSRTLSFRERDESEAGGSGYTESQLRQWPVQMHLISPSASYFQGADVLLAADCTAFAAGGFHSLYLKGKSLAIACPKLDEGREVYVEKIRSMIDDAGINTLTVMMMEVPCCGGLLALAKEGAKAAGRKVPIKRVILSLQGDVLREEWVPV